MLPCSCGFRSPAFRPDVNYQGCKFDKNQRIDSHNDSCSIHICESTSLTESYLIAVVVIKFNSRKLEQIAPLITEDRKDVHPQFSRHKKKKKKKKEKKKDHKVSFDFIKMLQFI